MHMHHFEVRKLYRASKYDYCRLKNDNNFITVQCYDTYQICARTRNAKRQRIMLYKV